VGSLTDLFAPRASWPRWRRRPPPARPWADALNEARQDGLAALDDLAAGTSRPRRQRGEDLARLLPAALEDAAASPSPFTAQQIRDLEDQILEIARALVTYRLELAIGQCGVCSTPGSPVCLAVNRLDNGNAPARLRRRPLPGAGRLRRLDQLLPAGHGLCF
jgi:hypothetical protein